MMNGEIHYEVNERVATVTLNRPERKNAWSPQMEKEFRIAMEQAARDEDVRAIVITGAGSSFCVGADMGRLSDASTGTAASATQPVAPPGRPSLADYEQRYSWLLAIDKPLIAAINGAVAGVGLCLTLYCDIRYMADGTRLSTAFVRRGLIAEHGSAWMLPRLIGPMNAADLLLSGRTIDAAEAHSLGLVRLLPSPDFMKRVHDYAAELATRSSPRSMGIIKRQLRDATAQSLAQAIIVADEETRKCRQTEDFKEGVASYLQKRPPMFSGR